MRTHYGPWQPCWISNQHQKHKSGRGPSNEHFWQVWLKSVQRFQRRRVKWEKLTDGRTTDAYPWQKLTWPMARCAKNQQSRQTGSRNLMGPKTLPTIWGTSMKFVTKYQISAINSCWEKCDEKCAYMFNVYKNQLSRQTGSRNLTGPKTFPTIWHTYMKLVTKYQIPVINNCLEKCDEKCAYTKCMLNVYKNQQNRQTGSRNLMGPKTLPTIWHTYMKLVTKYHISAINSCWEKCDEKWAYMFNVYN